MAYIQDWGMRVQAQPQINTTRRAFLHLSQNENGRMLNIRITDVNIPTGSTAVLAGTKPDGTVYSQAGTLAGNTATFAEDVQMTAVTGTWDAKITITNGGNCICTARITITIDPDTVAGGAIPSDSQLDGIIAECRAIADSVRKEAYGSPLVADAVEDMTDQSRVYVYTGSETGYTSGHWYYYNNTVNGWVDGGDYGNAVSDDELNSNSVNPVQNKTLSSLIDFVTPQYYGAKGTGIDDDTAAIQTAMDSGKIVYFPKANYLVHGKILVPAGSESGEIMRSLKKGSGVIHGIQIQRPGNDGAVFPHKHTGFFRIPEIVPVGLSGAVQPSVKRFRNRFQLQSTDILWQLMTELAEDPDGIQILTAVEVCHLHSGVDTGVGTP